MAPVVILTASECLGLVLRVNVYTARFTEKLYLVRVVASGYRPEEWLTSAGQVLYTYCWPMLLSFVSGTSLSRKNGICY